MLKMIKTPEKIYRKMKFHLSSILLSKIILRFVHSKIIWDFERALATSVYFPSNFDKNNALLLSFGVTLDNHAAMLCPHMNI